MKISVFTPSHKPDFLHEVWGCLAAQTHTDWEWVVLPNGPMASAVRDAAEGASGGDGRVAFAYGGGPNVGDLKRRACEAATGELFLEYDHDDLITPDCLAAVAEAASKCPRSCFIYSDDVTCDWKGNSHVFSRANGWRQYPWSYEGREYAINEQFPITPRSLCDILYAPDHVRVWSRQAYELAGGHDPALRVGDDHDLVVRTYLKGVHFHHIDRPLYVHRLKPDTTSQTSLAEIAYVSKLTRDRHLHGLVREWCRRERLPMYDLGGEKTPGFMPATVGRAGLATLRDFTPNSVGCFRAADVLNYFSGEDAVHAMNYVYAALVPGGWLLTSTPSVSDDAGRVGRGAFEGPLIKSHWSVNNFRYFTEARYSSRVYTIWSKFQAVRLETMYPSEWHEKNHTPHVVADLCAIKDGRYWPGELFI